jgi:ATP-binding cassette, subfamily F, member 3
MSLLTASDLAKSYGPVDLFSGISLAIPRRARIGLVGPNGVGKTTLLRLLAGIEQPSRGVVHIPKAIQLGYLPQEADLFSDRSLLEECLAVFDALQLKEAELAGLEQAMANPETRDEALRLYGPAQEAFEQQGGYTYRTRIKQTLSGLGFSDGDYKRPLSQLSGGQRTRTLLARLLLADPDLVALDEPTNHLDIAAVEWLERYLREWKGGAVIVSHDRYFLDRVVDTIWELTPMGFEIYRGNYSAYLNQRSERWELRDRIFKVEIARLEKELDYIRRNIAGQNTTQAKGRLRRLSRQIEAIEQGGLLAIHGKSWGEISEDANIASRSMGVEEAASRIKSLHSPIQSLPDLKLRLRSVGRSGDLVLRTRSLVVGFPDEAEPLFDVPDLLLQRGECAGIIGPNGVGKTTFLKTILGQLPPMAGEVVLGASLNIGYFAQAHDDLDPAERLVDAILSTAPSLTLAEVRKHLARFLFSGDDVFKSVSVLSGGERGRLALARLALTQANLLLLDEPTNHLDIPSQEILQAVLSEFSGTILLVSHDRYLIDALGSQIWEIGGRGDTLSAFKGSYTEYRNSKESISEEVETRQATAGKAQRQRPRGSSAPAARNADRHRIARLAEVEVEIHHLETRLEKLANKLETPPADLSLVEKLGEEYVETQRAIEELMVEWGELAEGPLEYSTRE